MLVANTILIPASEAASFVQHVPNGSMLMGELR